MQAHVRVEHPDPYARKACAEDDLDCNNIGCARCLAFIFDPVLWPVGLWRPRHAPRPYPTYMQMYGTRIPKFSRFPHSPPHFIATGSGNVVGPEERLKNRVWKAGWAMQLAAELRDPKNMDMRGQFVEHLSSHLGMDKEQLVKQAPKFLADLYYQERESDVSDFASEDSNSSDEGDYDREQDQLDARLEYENSLALAQEDWEDWETYQGDD